MSALDLFGAIWRVSSYSDGNEGTCVEVAAAPHHPLIATRDSTDRTGPVLCFNRREWAALLTTIKSGRLDA